MKNKKIITIIIVIIILITFVSFFSFFAVKFYRGYQEDKRKTNENLDIANITASDAIDFNAKREVLHNQIFVDNYYENMKPKVSEWEKLLDEYNVIVKNLDNDSNYLKDNCKTVKWLNNTVSTQCESFEFAYETIINSYISDINLYNESITGYNQWLKTNSNNELQPIEMYNNVLHPEYIDYNNDGEFFGKE